MIGLNRRRYNVVIPDYITDGLIFHLDGFNKGETEGIWTDLIGNRKFTNGGEAVFEKDCVRFTGTANSYLTGSNTPSGWTAGSYTIEVCFYSESTSGCVLFKGRTGGVALIRSGGFHGRSASSASSSIPRFSNNGTNPCTVSYTTDHAMQGFKEMAVASSTTYLNGGHSSAQIGARRTNATTTDVRLTGKIYDIRIYNRQLTLAEMLHNQKVDKLRYL